MTIPKLSKQFMLIGSPVAHSCSPILHTSFAEQFGFKIDYKLQDANLNSYLDCIYSFIEQGGSGFNITAPLKTEVFKKLQYADNNSTFAKAVNTVVIKSNGMLYGYNTDGVGLIRDLKRKYIPITGSKILILGAGGAVRGILGPLLSAAPEEIIIVNRDVAKAKIVADDFKDIRLVNIIESEHIEKIYPDIIINATSKTPGYIHNLNFKNTLCYDLNYIPKITEFMSVAKRNNAIAVYNGIGMLVEQAAVAFELWHGLQPNTNAVLELPL